MSRGNKESSIGIIKSSMRDNYAEHGVDEFYKKVGATYRNPHFPGVCNTMFLWLNKWWQMEHEKLQTSGFTVFDMACGRGEATIALMQWWRTARGKHTQQSSSTSQANEPSPRPTLASRSRPNPFMPPTIGPDAKPPRILAADPFTAEAFHGRTQLLNCSTLSFKEVADGALPEECLKAQTPQLAALLDTSSLTSDDMLEMTVCSFALHLIESPSELFSLLWQLSTRCRWLVVLAPHKRPEIKDGWGWTKWNVDDWQECSMSESKGEFLQDRVHCRIYRSLNLP